MTLLALLCLIFVYLVSSVYEDDYVSSIPWYTGNNVNFNTYSGYLNGVSGSLFYVLTESSNDPDNDPLVLWLNGGPLCSSLLGLFIEIGPYHPYNYGDNIEYNPYSWNNFANILFIESPPCTGFSYPFSNNCHTYKTNDNQTKWDNYIALQHFFTKFNEYKNRKFYITGESYAGHYIPQLAQLIINNNNNNNNNYININLISIGIGNPYINRDSNWFEGWIPSMYNFGIINNDQIKYLNSEYCSNKTLNDKCSKKVWQFIDDYLYDLNVYDVNVLANCSSRSRQETELLRYVYKSEYFVDNLESGNIWSYPYTPCNEYDLMWYLNSYDVWDSFHVNYTWMNSIGNINNNTWNVCSWYYNGYDINEVDDSTDQVQYIKFLLNHDISVLIYSGNNDLVCSLYGTRYWIYNRLNKTYTGNIRQNWTSWHVNGEVAGWLQIWDKFTFMVVRDAGHEVPEYQPIRAYSLFNRFLLNDYSDRSVHVEHTDWMDYYNQIDDNGDNTSNKDNTNDSLWIGIIIGVAISISFIILFVAFLWIKNNCLKNKIVQDKARMSNFILNEDNRNENENKQQIETTNTAEFEEQTR